MEFDAVLLPARRQRMVEQGFWHDRTINDDLDACVAACPDKTALTAYRLEAGDVVVLRGTAEAVERAEQRLL